ncbi:MAG: glutathionylspermidine synthase family protein [Polyangiaceae bacterium]|nr:glutathionylspermidine synthase family protein [Polyangiaceae bacterium]
MSDPSLPSYDDFAAQVVDSGIVTDPWVRGKPRLAPTPLLVSEREQQALYRATEQVASVYNDVCRMCADEPELLDSFFQLTPFQKAMWESSRPMWHGIARADVFVTDEGLAFAELNSDTPTGQAEATVLNQAVHPRYPDTLDPNAALGATYCEMVEGLAEYTLGPGFPRALGIVYPTEFTEDLGVIRLFKRWFEERGWSVVLGSPYNLTLDGQGRACLFDVPFSVMLRHYKTDWWGERASAWDDENVPDTEPLREPLGIALAAALTGKLCIVNPFGAVLPQNKRCMAFMWEHIHRFGPGAQEVIRRFIPATFRLEVLDPKVLVTEREDWVLKSDYGAEGEEVIIGKLAKADDWQKCLTHARPGRWVAQRYFEARANEDGEVVNYGVYLVAGCAAGLYCRTHKGATTDEAISVATLVKG